MNIAQRSGGWMFQERAGVDRPAVMGVDGIVDAVRRMLGKGGALPPERVLAGQLGVKRHRLRQALEAMRAQNELAPAVRRGAAASVTPGEAMIRGTNPLEVIELRMVLEPALARQAAIRASPEEIARIVKAATTAPGAAPGQADLLFHGAVAAGGRNGLAADMYALLRRVGTDARLRVNRAEGPALRVATRDAEHQRIAAAIAARDPAGAEAAMRNHLQAVQRRVLAGLDGGHADAA